MNKIFKKVRILDNNYYAYNNPQDGSSYGLVLYDAELDIRNGLLYVNGMREYQDYFMHRKYVDLRTAQTLYHKDDIKCCKFFKSYYVKGFVRLAKREPYSAITNQFNIIIK